MSTYIRQGIINPPIDELLDKVDSKYRLVLFAAKRARQINAYYANPSDRLDSNIGPLVEVSHAEKPLTSAMREIEEDYLECIEYDPEVEMAQRLAAQTDPEYAMDDADFAPLDILDGLDPDLA